MTNKKPIREWVLVNAFSPYRSESNFTIPSTAIL